MRTQFYRFGCVHQLKVRTVILRRHVGVEPFIVELGEHVASFIVRPHPIEESLFDFVCLLHGGGCQFLINDHDRVAALILVAAVFFHLDRSVDEQGFNDF